MLFTSTHKTACMDASRMPKLSLWSRHTNR
jgi:hypothetical protein